MGSINPAVQTAPAELYAVPLTLEGLSVLHQMFRFRWAEWRKLSLTRQHEIAREAASVLAAPEEAGQSAAYSMLGHKGDLMLVHFRDSFDELNAVGAAVEPHCACRSTWSRRIRISRSSSWACTTPA